MRLKVYDIDLTAVETTNKRLEKIKRVPMRAMERIMMGVTKKDWVKNEDLRNKSRMQDIINTIKLKTSGQFTYDKNE